jgi:hypothetical protein
MLNLSVALYEQRRYDEALLYANSSLQVLDELEDTRAEEIRRHLLDWHKQMPVEFTTSIERGLRLEDG